MPNWVKDHKIWEKAKKVVKPSKNKKLYWANITTVYKLMGGRIR